VTACHALVLVDIGGDELEAAFFMEQGLLNSEMHTEKTKIASRLRRPPNG
jgi:hypothetical protein